MQAAKDGVFVFLKNLLAGIALVVILGLIFLYFWPLIQGGYEELSSFLQIPFEILLDIFTPKAGMMTASGQENNAFAFPCLGFLFFLVALLLIMTFMPKKASKKGKKEEKKEEE